MTRTRRVTTTDGCSLAVFEDGDPHAPVLVCVHGYPDNHTLWNGVTDELAERYRVVRYDVRGAGASDKPRERSAYRLDQLAADLGSVIDEVSPDRPVHLLAHDWGSIQSWHAVTGAQSDRIASYTSLSGPCLDHAARWMRSRLRPNPRALRELVTQLAESWYIGFFHLAPLPELLWRTPAGRAVLNRMERAGAADAEPRVPAERSRADLLHGLKLYRANMGRRMQRPEVRRTDTSVQVLAPTGDAFVSPALQSDIGTWVPNLRVRRIAGSHWVPRTRPDVIARATAELVDHVQGQPEAPALRAAHNESNFAERLVVITGAGSGIGRATALAFGERGARVIATDVDSEGAQQTAELVRAAGAHSTAHTVDVTDPGAVQALADTVRTEHGVADIVVNNAGVGVAGSFLDTEESDWRQVVNVNLWGTVHGCRAFARQMVDRGEGGQIINVASAAAYVPSRNYPAYSTTKSAVLALSRCLRAELEPDGVGVVAVCPGLVNTNITATTRFAGSDDAEQDRRRARLSQFYSRRGFSPQRAADAIVRAARHNPEIAPVTTEARLGLMLSRLSPRLMRAAAKRPMSS